MKYFKLIRWLLSVQTLLNLVQSFSVSDATKGLQPKDGEDIQKNVNDGSNFTGMEEILEGVLDAALQYKTTLPVASKDEAKRPENDSTRKIKTYILDDNQLHQRIENTFNSASKPINMEDIIKLRRIEDYYKRVLTGELRERPNPKEIERHRSVLVNIFNQLMTQSTDRRLSSNIKELLSTLTNITDLGTSSASSKVDSQLVTPGTTIKSTIEPSSKKKDHSDNKNTIILFGLPDPLLENSRNVTEMQSDPVVVFKETVSPVSVSSEPNLNASTNDDVSKISLSSFHSGLNTMNVPTSENKFDSLENHNAKLSSPPDVSGAEKLVSNSTISKRYGQTSETYADTSPYSLNLYGPHPQGSLSPSTLPKTVYITYPQLQQGFTYQPSPNLQPLTQGSRQYQRGTLNSGAFNRLSSHLTPTADSIPESPLAITDSATLQGGATKNLFDVLLQYTRAGSLLEYNNQLENALEALLSPQKASDLLFVDNVNLQGLAVTLKPPNRSPLSTGFGSVGGISPEILANLLIRMQLPTDEEIRNISLQLTRFGSAIQDTRQGGTLPASIQDLLLAITTAITDIITAITMFCSMNPLVCVLLALALCALFVHIYKHHGKKKKYHHKDSGYGGGGHDHGGGYHRKTLLDYSEYRMLDSDTQLEVVSDVLGKIDVVENWLQSLRSKDKLNDTKSRYLLQKEKNIVT